MRAFIAIEVGFSHEMEKLYRMLKETGAKLKMVEPENIHLTIKFLGEIDEEMVRKVKEEMMNAVSEVKPFRGVLRGIGAFPGKNRIRVIWIGFHDNGEVVKISKAIDEGISRYGFKKEKSYVPHITIARMKGRERKEKVLQIIEEYEKKEFGEIECREIKLKKSILTPKGPIYEDLEVVEL